MEYKKLFEEIEEARQKIKNHILKTPLILSHPLSESIQGEVYLKLENEQYTGSFKARGSLNKVLSLSDEEIQRGMITASTGNHGLGFARAMEITGNTGTIYLPESASRAKVEALNYYPVQLEFFAGDSLHTEIHAKKVAKEKNSIWISPYNDFRIIAGQGTIGIEIIEELPHPDHVLITVGGGGLISGIGCYLKMTSPLTNIIACQPENSPEMTLSLSKGKITNLETFVPTLSDGSAGGIEEGSVTFPICQKVVDHSILVSEEEIARALKLVVHKHHKIIEGSAAVAVASLLKEKERFKGSTVVVVICGGNIDIEQLKEII